MMLVTTLNQCYLSDKGSVMSDSVIKEYMVSNTKSLYFGLSVYSVEYFEHTKYNEFWVKVVLDFAIDGSFKEVSTWFRDNELEEI